MKTQQRSFVVEIKSTRRRSKMQPKSIWGDTDFKALACEAEAAHLFKNGVVSETFAPDEDLPPGLDQQRQVADIIDVAEDQHIVAPLIKPIRPISFSKLRFQRTVMLQKRWLTRPSIG